MRKLAGTLAGLAAALVLLTSAPAADVDSKLPDYKKADSAPSGTLKFVGSDTMLNLVNQWVKSFKKYYPEVQDEVEGKGSGTAMPALIAGQSSFGQMSRDLKATEIDAFKSKFGYAPIQLPSAIDMLAIYVHKDNPIKGLTFAQLDAVFGKERKRGFEKEVKTWGDLGLEGDWADKPIRIYGRNAASGTYGFLKEHVLKNGDYKDEVKEQPGSSAVVQSVASDKYGIGYSGIGYKTADVRVVPLKDRKDFVEAAPEHAYNGTYPLSRFLYLTVNYKPNSELDPLRREFLKYVYSKEGQTDVVKEGFLPLPARVAEKAMEKVGLK
jgi:phosphate transport system substrate-binding protein